MRLSLIGGSDYRRSIIANAQRCINLFPELNRKDSPVSMTLYQRPGLRPLAQGVVAPVRGLYRASNGNGYCVIGQNVYSIGANWALTQLGTLSVYGTNPVSMIDNGNAAGQLFLVDGSPVGYQILLANNAFSQIVDGTGTFLGATRVDYIDTFFIWAPAGGGPGSGTNQWGSTLSNSLTFDALYTAGKTDYPDPIVTLIVNRHEIILAGQLKSEIWYNAGNAQFPFSELPGAYIEHGIVAPYSIASEDINAYWLGQDLQGHGIVFQQRGYDTKRISNHALEYAIEQIVAAVGQTITDAIGYTWQQGGHVYYSLNFPSGNQTWVYDASVGDPTLAWHQEAWTDANGMLNRHRGNCCAFINGKNVVGDWQNGTIYEMDRNVYTDTLVPDGPAGPISFIRGFPHIFELGGPNGPISLDGKLLQFNQFRLDIESGMGPLESDGTPAKVGLRWSDDRGKTFKNAVLQSNGAPGEYITQPKWPGTGEARDRIFEVSYSIAGPAALQGAWVDAKMLAGT